MLVPQVVMSMSGSFVKIKLLVFPESLVRRSFMSIPPFSKLFYCRWSFLCENRYIKVLRARIRELEDDLARANERLQSGDTATAARQPARIDQSPSPIEEVTAMGAISAVEEMTNKPSPAREYYGSSSAASLMRLVNSSLPQSRQTLGPQNNSTLIDIGGSKSNIQGSLPHCQVDDFSLPSRPLADRLLQFYWDRVYLLYPFIHRSSFETIYENLWRSARERQTQTPSLAVGLGSQIEFDTHPMVFHCALNVMFALGCHFSDIPFAEREGLVERFFLQSKRLLGTQILETNTLGLVQCFLTMSLFLQSTPFPNRCWNAVGIACRVAESIGLHVESVSNSMMPLEREIRRRTWHGCVLIDRQVHFAFLLPKRLFSSQAR